VDELNVRKTKKYEPYNLALLIFRLLGIALALYLLYAFALYALNPTKDMIPETADVAGFEAQRQKGLLRGLILYGGGSALFYFAAPLFARLASAGAKD
jgi:hypothetical protein